MFFRSLYPPPQTLRGRFEISRTLSARKSFTISLLTIINSVSEINLRTSRVLRMQEDNRLFRPVDFLVLDVERAFLLLYRPRSSFTRGFNYN